MELIANILLAAGALGAGIYCLVLASRLKGMQNLEGGLGQAVSAMSAQVDDLTKTLALARGTSEDSVQSQRSLTERAEKAAQRLELLIASIHDLPEPPSGANGRNSSDRSERTEPDLNADDDTQGPMFVRHRTSTVQDAAT